MISALRLWYTLNVTTASAGNTLKVQLQLLPQPLLQWKRHLWAIAVNAKRTQITPSVNFKIGPIYKCIPAIVAIPFHAACLHARILSLIICLHAIGLLFSLRMLALLPQHHRILEIKCNPDTFLNHFDVFGHLSPNFKPLAAPLFTPICLFYSPWCTRNRSCVHATSQFSFFSLSLQLFAGDWAWKLE